MLVRIQFILSRDLDYLILIQFNLLNSKPCIVNSKVSASVSHDRLITITTVNVAFSFPTIKFSKLQLTVIVMYYGEKGPDTNT